MCKDRGGVFIIEKGGIDPIEGGRGEFWKGSPIP